MNAEQITLLRLQAMRLFCKIDQLIDDEENELNRRFYELRRKVQARYRRRSSLLNQQ